MYSSKWVTPRATAHHPLLLCLLRSQGKKTNRVYIINGNQKDMFTDQAAVASFRFGSLAFLLSLLRFMTISCSINQSS